MRYLVIETDLFFTDIPDDQIDHWFIGADCAGWFYARLLPIKEIRQHLNPTMEDWGWIMAVEVNGIVVEICIWEDFDHEKHWILGVTGKKKILRRTDPAVIRRAEQAIEGALNAIVDADTRFLKAAWFDHNPVEKRIESLH